ncbi:MAG: hypothetical protein OXF98_04580 [Rhodospirillaceae bacterium]|nr:hypothetical protein [Rhodospirillaceae bacterium]
MRLAVPAGSAKSSTAMNFVALEVVRVRFRVAHDHSADLMQEMAQIRTAAGLGAQGIVLDDGYGPEYANT